MSAFVWRDFVFTDNSEEIGTEGYYFENSELFIGVSREGDRWDGCLEYGGIEVENSAATREEVLDMCDREMQQILEQNLKDYPTIIRRK